MESWEIHWKDYYKILQVDPIAEQEVIEAAYRKLARRYHPDVDKDATSHERMKDLNEAFEYLGDLGKRSEYHSEWLRRSGESEAAGTGYGAHKPKPVVEPDVICFKDVRAREIRTASFTINNEGGPYEDIWFDDPGGRDSWVRVVGYQSTTSDELPLEVVIEAEGDDWGKSYTENIRVKLDEEETQVRIELQTRSEPARVKVGISGIPKATRPPAPPPPIKTKAGIPAWGKWLLGVTTLGFIIVLAVGLVYQFWPTNASFEATSLKTPSFSRQIVPASIDDCDWFPDKLKIVFSEKTETTGGWSYSSGMRYRIFTMSPDGTNVTQLPISGDIGGMHYVAPLVSPDGQNIAFISTRYDQPSDVYVVDANGGEAKRISGFPKCIAFGWFSNDTIVYWSSGWYGIYDFRDSMGSDIGTVILKNINTGSSRELEELPPELWQGKGACFHPNYQETIQDLLK